MFTENLDELFNDFAVSATWHKVTQAGPPPVDINVVFDCIFDDDFKRIDIRTGVETTEIKITCKSSDVSGITHGADIEINSVHYKVRGIQPSGGITEIILSEN